MEIEQLKDMNEHNLVNKKLTRQIRGCARERNGFKTCDCLHKTTLGASVVERNLAQTNYLRRVLAIAGQYILEAPRRQNR